MTNNEKATALVEELKTSMGLTLDAFDTAAMVARFEKEMDKGFDIDMNGVIANLGRYDASFRTKTEEEKTAVVTTVTEKIAATPELFESEGEVVVDPDPVDPDATPEEIYAAAVEKAAESKAAAEAAAEDVSTVELANAALTAANTAKTDADAVVAAAANTEDEGADDATAAEALTAVEALVTTATEAVEAAEAAALIDGSTFELTTSSTGDSFVGTDNNDLFEAANGTLQTADTILDSSSTDADIINAIVSNATAAPRVQNVETLNIDGLYTTTGINLTSVAGTTDLNLNTGIANGTATVTNAASINATNITAGANIATVDVTATASGTRDAVNVDAGSATTVTVTGEAGTDTFNVTVADGADLTLDLDAGTANIDMITVNTLGGDLTLGGNATAKTVTLNNQTAALTVDLDDNQTIVGTGTTSSWNITGDADVTFELADDADAAAVTDVEGIMLTNSGTGTVTLDIEDTASTTKFDLTQFAADVVDFTEDSTAAILVDVNSASVVKLSADVTANTGLTIDVGTSDDGDYDAGEGTAIVQVADNQTTGDLITADGVGTLILSANADEVTDTDADSNGTVDTEITITDLELNATTNTVVVQGAENLTISNIGNKAGATADTITASSMTGNLTIGEIEETATVVGGSGDDNVTASTAGKAFTIYGGAGDDTVTLTTADTAAKVYGEAGNDSLYGGTAADTIEGGTGDDTIDGNGGADTIATGAGSDTVIINKTDVGTTAEATEVFDVDFSAFNGADKVVFDSASYTAAGATTATVGASAVATAVAGLTFTNWTASAAGATVTFTNKAAGAVTDITTGDFAITDGGGAGTPAVSSLTVTTQGITAVAAAVDTISDFTTGTDTLVLTGAAAGNVKLTDITPASNVYDFDGADTFNTKLTNVTATDVSDSVQLGMSSTNALGVVSYTTFGAFDGSTVVAGDKDDVIAVATTESATITSGDGADSIILTAGTASAVTVDDFTVGTDKIIVTGAATDNASVDLTSNTPATGAYTIDAKAVVTLENASTAFTATDISTMVQLGVSTADAYDITSSTTAVSITSGVFNDFIDLTNGTAAITVNFEDNSGMDTILAFTTGTDKLSFDGMTAVTATSGTATTGTTKIADGSDGAVYVFGDATAARTGTAKVDTFTADTDGVTADTILADVADYLETNLGEGDGENYIAIMNDGTDSYAYLVAGDADGIGADDLTLIGTFDSAIIATGDIA